MGVLYPSGTETRKQSSEIRRQVRRIIGSLLSREPLVYNLYWQKAKKEEELKLSLLPTCGIVLVDETNTKRGGKDDYNSKSGLWQEGN